MSAEQRDPYWLRKLMQMIDRRGAAALIDDGYVLDVRARPTTINGQQLIGYYRTGIRREDVLADVEAWQSERDAMPVHHGRHYVRRK